MNLIALVCKQERDVLQRSGLIGERTAQHPFTITQWTSNRVVSRFPPLRTTRYHVSHFLFDADCYAVTKDDGTDASLEFDHQLDNCNAVVLFAGPSSSGQNGIVELIDRLVDSSSQPIFIVFALCEDSRDVVAHISALRQTHFLIPDDGQFLRLDGNHLGNLTPYHWTFADAVKEVLHAQMDQPTLGVGALLVSRNKGLFFLSRRTWGNGYDTFGTFGGPLQSNGTVVDTVLNYGEQRFHIPAARIAPGPMLACTNVRSATGHYVDMTFLFTTAEPIQSPIEGTQWCTIGEMQRHLENGMLYRPVANAFMRYCALESYSRLSRALISPPALSWIQPDLPETAGLPTDELIAVAGLLRSQEPRQELWPLFFESQ
jgi:hypothetical protein